MYRIPLPGELSAVEQLRAGRRELLGTSFEHFERECTARSNAQAWWFRPRVWILPRKDVVVAAATFSSYVLATGNTRDFTDCGIELVNPFDQ